LGDDLDADVLGDASPLDKLADEVEVRLRGRRKCHLDLLEAERDQEVEEARLALGVHGFDQGLVAVAQVGGTPARGLRQGTGRPLTVRQGYSWKGTVFVLRSFQHERAPSGWQHSIAALDASLRRRSGRSPSRNGHERLPGPGV